MKDDFAHLFAQKLAKHGLELSDTRETILDALTEYFTGTPQSVTLEAKETLADYDNLIRECDTCGNQGWIRTALSDTELCEQCPYGALEAWAQWLQWAGVPESSDTHIQVALKLTRAAIDRARGDA